MCFRWVLADSVKRSAQINETRTIKLEGLDRCAPDWVNPIIKQKSSCQAKVLVPEILAGMKQRHGSAG